MPLLAPSMFCAVLCSRALEARGFKRDVPVFHLYEPVSVPVLVRAGRACSSLVRVLLLCCLGAGKRLVRPPCPPAPCPAEGAGSPFGLRLGRDSPGE